MTQSNIDLLASSLSNDRKRHLGRKLRSQHRAQGGNSVLWIDMTGPYEEDTPDRRTSCKHQSPEVAIVSHNNALFISGALNELPITASNQSFTLYIENIVTLCLKELNDLGMNVFISEERRRSKRHEFTSVVMTTSFSRNRAA